MRANRPKDMTDAERAELPEFDPKVAMPDIKASFAEPHDVLLWTDGEGRRWIFGQYTDGQWFKKRM